MLVIFSSHATDADRRRVDEIVREAGCTPRIIDEADRVIWKLEGELDRFRDIPLGLFPGVAKVVPIRSRHMLSSLAHQSVPTVVKVGNARFGGVDGHFTIIGGPCAVEDEGVLLRTARAVKAAGAHVLRGGAYKPRTNPYTFRGLGLDGLKMLREASQETGLPVVSEVCDPRHIEACISNVDMLQIGTRNMSNFDLLIEVGKSGHPVMLKRGRSATLADWLSAAEYILAQGNANVVLCERGIRGFDSATRNQLDLAAVPALRARTHLPIIVDPAHATGHAEYVAPMALAACAAGADGVMVEVHEDPLRARCDARQALRPAAFLDLCEDLQLIAAARRSRTTGTRESAHDLGT